MLDNKEISLDELMRLESIDFDRRHSTPYPENNEKTLEMNK